MFCSIVDTAKTLVCSLGSAVDADRLMQRLDDASPEIQRLFVTYAAEAIFFRHLLDPEVRSLPPTSRVIEIGSGIGLLARLIAAEGHRVMAFEPETAGFDRMHAVSDLLDRCWTDDHDAVTFVRERFSEDPGRRAELVVALNVIEHTSDPAGVVLAATRSLVPGGSARFICPNYAFPYEPHLNMPTLISKSLTNRVARRAIRRSSIPDAQTFWDDLSWPTTRSLGRALTAHHVDHRFSRSALEAYADRLREPTFLDRKGGGFRAVSRLASGAIAWGASIVPLAVAPIIDLTTTIGPLRVGPNEPGRPSMP